MKDKLIDKVYNKFNQEYINFIQEIIKLPPSKIIENAYSITIKQELVSMIYGSSLFSSRELKALLEIPNALDYLYNSWFDSDGGIHTIIYETLEDELYDLSEKYSKKLLVNVEKNKNINFYSDISAVLSNIDYFNLCSDLKEKFDIEELDVIDIDTIFKSKDGVKSLYNFFNNIQNNDKYKRLSETNDVVYKNIERIKNNILPRLEEIISKDKIKRLECHNEKSMKGRDAR